VRLAQIEKLGVRSASGQCPDASHRKWLSTGHGLVDWRVARLDLGQSRRVGSVRPGPGAGRLRRRSERASANGLRGARRSPIPVALPYCRYSGQRQKTSNSAGAYGY
jgi:hypothetical protein